MKLLLFKYKYIIILLALTIISHLEWFNLTSILFNYDFQLRNNEILDGIFTGGWDTWIWFYNFGAQNIQMNSWFHTFFWGLIGDYSIATKLNLFIPLALLSVLSPFFLIKYLTKDSFASFVGATVYGFNTYILTKQLDHLTIAIVYALFPLVFLFFYKLINEKENYIKNVIFFSVLYTILIIYEIRITFIASLVLAFFLLFNMSFATLKRLILPGFLVALLSLYWIIPYGSFEKGVINNLTSRTLFGDHLFSLLNALLVFDWHWTGGFIPFRFSPQTATFYSFFPFIFLIFLIIRNINLMKNKPKKNFIVFLLITFVLGVLITKQSANPFPDSYRFLFQNVPGFNLFREVSKFYLITGFALSTLIGIYIFQEKNSIIKYGVGSIVILVALMNLKPFILQEAGDMLKHQEIPVKYQQLNNFIRDDSSTFKTLWIPFYSHFGYADIDKPKMSLWHLLNPEYAGTPYLKEFTELSTGIGNFKNPELYADIVRQVELMRITGIKYVIIPAGYKKEYIEFPNNIFPYAGNRDDYIHRFDKIEGLKKITDSGFDDIAVYEVPNYNSLIFISKEDLKRNIQSEIINLPYLREFRNSISTNVNLLDTDIILNFSQTKNKNWRVTLIDGFDIGDKIDSYEFMNSWKVSKKEILEHTNRSIELLKSEGYPKNLGDGKIDYKYYILNPDGSISTKLIIRFHSQSLFYVGLFISILVFILLFTYIIYNKIIGKK